MSASALIDHQQQFVAPPPQNALAARIGRIDAELLGASSREAHLRHCGSLKVGAEVPLSFAFAGTRIQTTAIVRSCRVAQLGGGRAGATLYESCLELIRLTGEEQQRIENTAGEGV